VNLIHGGYHCAQRERQEKIGEKLTVGKLPKAHRWTQPLDATAKRFSPTTLQFNLRAKTERNW